MLELRGVTGGYDSMPVLQSICLKLDGNQIASVIGPNGCGKSTLLRTVAGLLKPLSGSILLEGKDIQKISRLEYAKRVSFLPQARSIPNMPVNALVMHGRHPHLNYPRRCAAADKRIVEEAMELTGAIAYRDRNMLSLSGGERQKAYIAMCVAQDTDVLLMDEPTTYLDIHHQFEIMELAKTLRQRGKLLLLVLHDLNLALNYSDRVIVMENGLIRACEPPGTLCDTGLIDEVFRIRTESVEGSHHLLFRFEEKGGTHE